MTVHCWYVSLYWKLEIKGTSLEFISEIFTQVILTASYFLKLCAEPFLWMDSNTTNEFCFRGSVMQIKKLWITDCFSVKKKSWKFCIPESFFVSRVMVFSIIWGQRIFQKVCLCINYENCTIHHSQVYLSRLSHSLDFSCTELSNSYFYWQIFLHGEKCVALSNIA